jgi:hypothetical protein
VERSKSLILAKLPDLTGFFCHRNIPLWSFIRSADTIDERHRAPCSISPSCRFSKSGRVTLDELADSPRALDISLATSRNLLSHVSVNIQVRNAGNASKAVRTISPGAIFNPVRADEADQIMGTFAD